MRSKRRRGKLKTRRERAAFAAMMRINTTLDAARLPLTADLLPLYGIIQRWHYRRLGTISRIRRATTYNQRIHWLMLFDQDPRKTRLSDKLLVKDAVVDILGEDFVVPVLQEADSFDDLRFESLPSAFVLKTNHDSGGVEVVRDAATWDRDRSREFFRARLAKPYGLEKGEWQYRDIERRVFVEEYLDEGTNAQPDDFKFHCVDGEVRFVQHLRKRVTGRVETVLDVDGEELDIHFSAQLGRAGREPLPKNWPQMVEAAKLLSRGFKYVRVDLYSIRGQTLVGELSFTPKAGCYRGRGQEQLGALIDFDTMHGPVVRAAFADSSPVVSPGL